MTTTKKLFFGGLDARVTERVLFEIAQFAGPVQSVRLPLSSVVFGGGGGGGGAGGARGNDDDDDEAAAAAEGAAATAQQHAGFGFVVFEDSAAALYCLEMLRDSLYLYGRKVRVELSSG